MEILRSVRAVCASLDIVFFPRILQTKLKGKSKAELVEEQWNLNDGISAGFALLLPKVVDTLVKPQKPVSISCKRSDKPVRRKNPENMFE